jgi:alpha-1,2-mannosyltransferase
VLPSSPIARVVLLVLALGLGYVAVERAGRESNDFDGFHRAATLVVEHGELSDHKSVERYPPSFPILLAPLGALPIRVAAALWFLLNLAALLALPRELERLSGVPPAGQRAAFLVSLPFLVDDLALGQSGPLLLWLSTAGVVRCVSGRAAVGGGLVAVAAALKVLPALLLAVPLMVAGRRRALAAVGGFAGALLLVAALGLAVVGVEELQAGHQRWTHEISFHTPERMVELDRSLRHNNQSLWIAAFRTLGDTSSVRHRDWPRLASLPTQQVWALVGAVLVGLAALAGWAALRARRQGAPAAEPLFGLACLGMLFLSPLVWTHYYLWVLPAVLAARRRPRLVAWGGAAFALGLASESLRSLGWHALGALALFALLAVDAGRSGSVSRSGAPADPPSRPSAPGSAGGPRARASRPSAPPPPAAG